MDDTAVIGCITGRDNTACWREVDTLVTWCEDNKLNLNTDKTKEMTVDNEEEEEPSSVNAPLRTEVKRVRIFKYLGVHISEDLTWTLNTTQLVKKV